MPKEESGTYTCPMHPEIIQSHPGFCPICGMALEPMSVSAKDLPNNELIEMSRRFWIGVILAIPLLFLAMGMSHAISPRLSSWLQFVLATLITLGCGWPLLKRGWVSLTKMHLNMFTLIALGVGVAYCYSVVALLFPHLFPAAFYGENGAINLYFEAAGVIIVLVLMGQVLELKGREQTGSALRALLDLTPKKAHKIIDNNEEVSIPLDQVQINDQLRIRPGEKIPIDGVITEGHGVIDESMMTGEMIPVEKEIGSTVMGGTVNVSGSFIMRVTRVGNQTLLAQIIQQVAIAQRSRAPIQQLVDRISSYFVPVVLIVAFVTFFVWAFWGPPPAMTYGLISAISVLIIACPCALGLATPMSVMVGLGRGAQAGILIKNADSLEQFEKVNVLVIDKTGTLTVGKPQLKTIIPTAHFNEQDILFFAGSLENNSEHPLANAIVNAAKAKQIALQKATECIVDVGKGIRGIVDNKPVALGNIRLLELLQLQPGPFANQAEQLRYAGETVLFVVIEGQISGLISIVDAIKPTTPAALEAIHKVGIRIVMVTGDNRITAEAVAKSLAINQIEANVLPHEKYDIVKRLREEGNRVAMAGDGINDASALAEADVGIAMGTGTEIAMKSASITLVKGDLLGIVRARQLSGAVMRNIRQNLWLAFGYNILCIPIAAGVLYPWTGFLLNPMISALAMSLSSFSVIANALRLQRVVLLNPSNSR